MSILYCYCYRVDGHALSFQHFPRDLAKVNEWKIMIDPSSIPDLYSSDPSSNPARGPVRIFVIIDNTYLIILASRCVILIFLCFLFTFSLTFALFINHNYLYNI